MGSKRTYKCIKCDYTVLTSAGKDWGMIAVVDTYICNSCKNIVDVCIDREGETYKRHDILFKNMKNKHRLDLTCPKCSSKTDLIKWKTRLRPCPKCDDGKMEVDPDGKEILWD
jgi:Zn finger protein HypA/HybF involved in hydrogenase expression